MKKISSWVKAMRLRTLPLSFSTIFTGAALAINTDGWNNIVFILALLTTLFLQVLSNFANDYGDFVKGADNEKRIGPARSMQSGEISMKEMKAGIIITSLLSLGSGVTLIIFATHLMTFYESVMFFVFGICAILAALFYTIGKRAYGYSGLGDLFVFIFFGLLGVGGSYYLLSHEFVPEIWLPASAIGFLSAGVLNLNNMRDHINDRESGKNTLVVRIGFERAKKYQAMLVTSGLFCFVLYMGIIFQNWHEFIALISAPLFIFHIRRVKKIINPVLLDPELKKLAISVFIFSILFFAGQIINLY